MALGEEATGKDTKGIFHFNPGIEQKTFPDYNPYTIRRCHDCDIAKGKLELAFIPENELCAACRLIHQMEKDKEPSPSTRSRVKRAQKDLTNWYKINKNCHMSWMESSLRGVLKKTRKMG